MPYNLSCNPIWCECPCCGLKAIGNTEITNLFGWRTMENENVIPQSYCYECRVANCKKGEPCKVIRK